ncbi:DUF2249 domain-containing protein [Bacillus marinisedimentorum]|uniref:DUF2249 domain-containing protein n=1 Tax=Bacillus marinisedimentorum TaxID=1821260 RepID=UPI000871F5BE|nr:DUF2249 domain-containing protein [Bacillus marinisedimentorum]
MAAPSVVELDVREDLLNKREPFQKIMEAVGSLQPEDVFVLHATIKPVPLISLMKAKGYKAESEKIDSKHWQITFKRGDSDEA